MFTEETKLRIVRTAFYLGEAFTRQCPHLKWETAKSGVYRDKPVLTGFRHGLEFCPLNLVEVQAWKVVRRQATKTELIELFNIFRVKVCYLAGSACPVSSLGLGSPGKLDRGLGR
jgi:hypothetical protein